jgi:hypothetical protein
MDTQLKKIKSRFKFFATGGGRQTITFFQIVQPIKIIMDTIYRLLTKSNGYTVHKKSRFKFFCGRREWADHYFFVNCVTITFY